MIENWGTCNNVICFLRRFGGLAGIIADSSENVKALAHFYPLTLESGIVLGYHLRGRLIPLKACICDHSSPVTREGRNNPNIEIQIMPLGRGILVAIEGIDRAGKSTQIEQLTRYGF